MHVNLSFVDIIFHFCIFGLLIHSIIYPIKQYVIPFLYSLLDKEKNQQMEIIEKDKLLTSTHFRLQNQIKLQKKSFIILERNVQRWHKAQQDQFREKEAENRLHIQLINDRRVQQKRGIYTSSLLKKALPEALINAKEKIKSNLQSSSNPFTVKSIEYFLQQQRNEEKS